MTTRTILADVSEGLRAQSGRAWLSVLSIAVGMMALTVLLAALGGLREKARHLADELGINVFAMVPDNPGTTDKAGDCMDERIVSLLAANLENCSVTAVKQFTPAGSDTPGPASLIATDEKLLHVRQWPVIRGRFFDAYDLNHRSRTAVISEDLATVQGWDIGKTVKLRNILFTVVGVVSAGSGSMEEDTPGITPISGRRTVYVPATTASLWMGSDLGRNRSVDAIFIRLPAAGTGMADAMKSAGKILSAPDVACKGFSWITPEKLLVGIRKLQTTILITVGSIALLCILLGGTTLAGLLAINVRDRVQEIGLRQALGARKSDIAALFVLEGLIMAGTGSCIGTILAHVFIIVARTAIPCPTQIGAATVVGPMMVSVVVGTIASYWPARLATSIMPAEALRNE